MTKILIKTNDIILHGTLNNTVAAQDFISRLPAKFTCSNSGFDYSCPCQTDKFKIDEMQMGWKNGDIIWSGGIFSLTYGGEKSSEDYHLMIIGKIKEEDINRLRGLPKEVEFEIELQKED